MFNWVPRPSAEIRKVNFISLDHGRMARYDHYRYKCGHCHRVVKPGSIFSRIKHYFQCEKGKNKNVSQNFYKIQSW